MWKSTDSGATWGTSSSGLPTDLTLLELAIDPVTPTTLYVGTTGGV